MANETPERGEIKTSVKVDGDLVARIKLSGERDKRPWTVQLVALAKEALDRRESASA